jgi:2-(1,2-epoxy-1,2-dihydrophenyl)acetyl-CoA isomerase
VSKVAPDDSLMEVSLELAHRLAQGPTQSLSLIKYLVHKGLGSDFAENLELAQAAQEQARQTQDHQEAVRAFLEKRPPKFQGR